MGLLKSSRLGIRACLLLAGVLLALSACVPPTPPPVSEPFDAARLLRKLEAANSAFHSLSGEAKVHLENKERSFSARQVLFVREPADFRSETLNPFGQPVLSLASDGSELSIMVPGEGHFYRGPATPANLERFTRLPLALPELVEILLYRVPVFEFANSEAGLGEDGRPYLRLLSSDNRVQEFRFDTALNPTAASYEADGKMVLKITFGDFSGSNPVFPQQVEIEVPSSGTRVSINYSDLRLNEAIPDERFVLAPRPGMDVLPLPQ